MFAEHAGEIFWLNRNGKGQLWLNAKASKYPEGDSGEDRGHRRPKKDDSGAAEPPVEVPAPVSADAPAEPASEPPASGLGHGPGVE